jgi:hypothetical protein
MNSKKHAQRVPQQPIPVSGHTPFRGGTVLSITIGLLAAGAIAWAGILSASSTTKYRRVIPPDQTEMMVLLAHAGLDPRSIAAAGVTPQQTSAIAAAARNYLGSNVDQIRTAESTYAHDQVEADRLQRLVQSGQAQPEDLAAYDAALTSLADSTAQRDTRLQALRDAATANLSDSVKAKIATIAGNRGWEVPIQYRTVAKTEPEWIRLQRALANQRINAGLGQPTSNGSQAELQTWAADPDVSAAAGYLDTNLPGITSAWNQNLPSP